MSSDQPSPETGIEARAEEAAAIRRRWLTLGEMLAVAAVLISALTLWLNWSERSDDRLQKAVETSHASIRAATLTLNAQSAANGKRIDLRAASPDQQIQEQRIAFPKQLGIDPIDTTGEPRIEAAWFEDALKKAREKAGLPDDSRGDERLPVIVTTRFLTEGQLHEDVTLYDIGYTIRGRMLSGHVLTLRGLSLARHLKSENAAAQLAARAARLLPAGPN
jgi:hypothetical protein